MWLRNPADPDRASRDVIGGAVMRCAKHLYAIPYGEGVWPPEDEGLVLEYVLDAIELMCAMPHLMTAEERAEWNKFLKQSAAA